MNNHWKKRKDRRASFEEIQTHEVCLIFDGGERSSLEPFDLHIEWDITAFAVLIGYAIFDQNGSLFISENFLMTRDLAVGDSVNLDMGNIYLQNCQKTVRELYEEFSS